MKILHIQWVLQHLFSEPIVSWILKDYLLR